MLEALSSFWWTADAMARLGRKALKSIKETGVRKASVTNIANAMEAEVAVCKFGPFEGRCHHSSGNATLGTRGGGGRCPSIVASTNGSGGNALHVLSDAAAAHSTSKNATSSRTGTSHHRSSSTATPTLTNTPTSLSTTKSPTTNTPQQVANNYSTGYSQVAPSTSANNSNANINMTMNINTHRPSRLSALGTTPNYNGHHNNFATNNALSQPFPSSMSTESFNPTMDAPSAFGVVYDTAFNDLDNLFEGFFDLSMPTIWQDPLFDGDAFSSADMDMAMGGMDSGMAGMGDDGEYNAGGAGAGMSNGKMGGGDSGSGYPEIAM